MSDETKGPYILWEYYSYEGWNPTSFANLDDAKSAIVAGMKRTGADESDFVITVPA